VKDRCPDLKGGRGCPATRPYVWVTSDVKRLRIMDFNPAAAEITDSTMENLRGRTLAEFPKP
jgi:hypothetical protein